MIDKSCGTVITKKWHSSGPMNSYQTGEGKKKSMYQIPDTSLREKHRQMGRQTYMMLQIDEYLVRISNKC